MNSNRMVQGRYGDYSKKILLVKQKFSEGKNSKEIADEIGLKEITVKTYRYRNGFSQATVRKSLEQRRNEINEYIIDDAHSIEEVAEILKVNYDSCYLLFLRIGISLLPFKNKYNRYTSVHRKPRVDEIIRGGRLETLREIGDCVGLSRERIRQYLRGTDQYELWQETLSQRKKVLGRILLQLNSGRENLISQITRGGMRNASEIERKAYELLDLYSQDKRYNHRRLSPKKALSFLIDYLTAFEEGEKKSLQKFSRDHNISLWVCPKLLKEWG